MRDFMTSEPGIAFDHPDISEGNEIPGSQPGEPTAAGTGRRRATAGRYRCS
jgi:hypothetical protein